jgi:hypothetical protein
MPAARMHRTAGQLGKRSEPEVVGPYAGKICQKKTRFTNAIRSSMRYSGFEQYDYMRAAPE